MGVSVTVGLIDSDAVSDADSVLENDVVTVTDPVDVRDCVPVRERVAVVLAELVLVPLDVAVADSDVVSVLDAV